MSESLLQKEWNERDIQRIRNLVSKKYNNKTSIQVGYDKEKKIYKEGDIWEENGRKYTINNGIKMSYSPLHDLKKEFHFPYMCPNCNKPMKKSKIDKKMWFIHKKCFDCVIQQEDLLKIDGEFDNYQKNIINQDINLYLEDIKKEISEYINNPDESILTEQGDIEEWNHNIDKQKIMNDFNEYIEKIKKIYNL